MNNIEIMKQSFEETINGELVNHHFLFNANGLKVGICNYGARITHYLVPCRKELIDVVLGFDDLESYINADELYYGVTVGRFANRIADAKFTLDGLEYLLEPNNGSNCLHGGSKGFHNSVWNVVEVHQQSIVLNLKISDLEDGFPGDLDCTVSFSLNDDNELIIDYKATSSKKTVINLTNHTYFNLNGEGRADILNHDVHINANQYAPINKACIPNNGLINVEQTPFDFTKTKIIGNDIEEKDQQLVIGKGYDHAYSLNKIGKGLSFAASAEGDKSGLKLEVFTTEPAIQFYTGNYLNGSDKGKAGNFYQSRFGFCFETQHFPDSPNQDIFPTTLLNPNEEFKSKTIYKINPI
nr:galactose mutarotase [Pseudopedobacter sp.]